MGITIDITKPEGNIFSAIGTASSVMKQLGKTPEEIKAMQKRVTSSGSYKEACDVITKETDGLVQFEDPRADE